MKYLQQFVVNRRPGAKLAYWSSAYRRDASPLLIELGPEIDHIDPEGGSEDKNLATACYSCNTRKSNMGAAAFLKKYPPRRVKGQYGEPKDWDGLTTLFIVLFEANRGNATPSEIAGHKALTQASGAEGGKA